MLKTLPHHPLRTLARGVWLCARLLWVAMDYALSVPLRPAEAKPTLRAAWMQRSGRGLLRVLNVQWETSGPVPHRGLLVSNHLTYVDILVLTAITPAAFVSKAEVRGWPVFGWFATIGGTIFVKREKRSEVARANAEIEAALKRDVLLVIFPEGTSSNGSTVLPFKSALLEPAAQAGTDLWVGHISYSLADGDVAQEVCYWADMTLVPHLINLLGKKKIGARVAFARVENPAPDRKELAKQLQAEVMRLGGKN